MNHYCNVRVLFEELNNLRKSCQYRSCPDLFNDTISAKEYDYHALPPPSTSTARLRHIHIGKSKSGCSERLATHSNLSTYGPSSSWSNLTVYEVLVSFRACRD